MSDFCKQCSIEIFGDDFRDMANITTKDDIKKGLYANVLCEHCGPIQIDLDGQCITVGCYENHNQHPPRLPPHCTHKPRDGGNTA